MAAMEPATEVVINTNAKLKKFGEYDTENTSASALKLLAGKKPKTLTVLIINNGIIPPNICPNKMKMPAIPPELAPNREAPSLVLTFS